MSAQETGITGLVRELESRGMFTLRPPPAPAAIAAAEAQAGFAFDPSVRALYAACDGADRGDSTEGMRPIPIADAVTQSASDPSPAHALGWAPLCTWTDDQDNSAGVYCAGPLRGMVFLLHHEENLLAPRYRSMHSFARALLDDPEAVEEALWRPDTGGEFPRFSRPDDPSSESDAAIARSLLAQAESEPDPDAQRVLRMAAIYLLPRSAEADMLRMLDVDDIWVPEAAAKQLGQAKATSALDRLADLARRGKPNGALAALWAIGQIGGERARAILLEAVQWPSMHNAALYLAKALESAGFQVRRLDANWTFFDPGSNEWRAL